MVFFLGITLSGDSGDSKCIQRTDRNESLAVLYAHSFKKNGDFGFFDRFEVRISLTLMPSYRIGDTGRSSLV